MGLSKHTHFNDNQNRIAEIAKALGHPARIAILEYLAAKNTCICTDLVNELPLAQATISQHLQALKNVGLIQGNISGNSLCYCINPNTLQTLQEYLAQMLAQITPNDSCCS